MRRPILTLALFHAVAWFVLTFAGWFGFLQAQDTRQFYTTPVDGAGTESDPWHSRCLGMPGAGNIDLRPEIDAFLCASNDLPADMTGVEQIGASFKSAIGGRKGALNAKFKKTLQATNVEDLIIEVVGPKLRAGKDGKLKLYLGGPVPVYQQTAWVPFRDNGLVADLSNAALGLIEPTLAWAATYIDTFPGSDNGTLGGDLTWTEYLSTSWQRISNEAKATGVTASAAEARAEHDTATDDQQIQAAMSYTYVSTGNFRCAVIGRKDSTVTRTFYQFGFQRDSGVNVYRLLYRVTGTATTLADSSSATSSPATIKLVIDGTSISGSVNGTLVAGPVTDATISGNTRGGLAYVGGDASDACTADNVSIQDYTPPAERVRGGGVWLP